eukprot:74295_1
MVNFIKRICCCCLMSDEFIPFDLAVFLMPASMKQRQVELNKHALYEQCEKQWRIVTNKGLTWCKFKQYEPEIMYHVVEFKENVAIRNSVESKKEWKLDMFELYTEGLISFKQFHIPVDQKYARKHQLMSKYFKKDLELKKSPYYICGYCRGYVQQASKISVKKLGFCLGVNPIEMKIINKLLPEICSNCYRVRLERSRWELIWELVGYWIFKLMIWCILVGISGILLFLSSLIDLHELQQTYRELRKQLKKSTIKNENALDRVSDKPRDRDWISTEELLKLYNGGDRKSREKNNDQEHNDQEHNDQEHNDQNEHEKNDDQDKHVSFHYSDTQLISHLNEMSMETDIRMFDDEAPDEVWTSLRFAKNNIKACLLKDD